MAPLGGRQFEFNHGGQNDHVLLISPVCSMWDQNSNVYSYDLNIWEHFGNTRISLKGPSYWISVGRCIYPLLRISHTIALRTKFLVYIPVFDIGEHFGTIRISARTRLLTRKCLKLSTEKCEVYGVTYSHFIRSSGDDLIIEN